MKNELNLEVGFSDHTEDYKASLYSICMGATYIEKHFTIDKNMEGPDHKASLTPEELKEFVSLIRECDVMFGNGIKKCKECELNTMSVARRSLCYSRDIYEGDTLREIDLIALRPNNGICVSKFEKYIGKVLIKNVKLNEQCIESDF
jgi:N,N'-diacetyllegionaminate synthase